ncbi:MAG: anthranilate phosphoribosyltransferase [Candidatus Nanopelagicales bacterium]
MWERIFQSLDSNVNLTSEQIDFAFSEILSEYLNPDYVKRFLTSLTQKGETPSEVIEATEIILKKAIPFPTEDFEGEITIDTCGTGGDGLHTLNISTMVALVVAASGTTVFKHGNRAASSKSGSADVLEALGININADAEALRQSAKEAKIAFLFAQSFHPALRFVAPIRRELGFRTIFNYLGPLANPARPNTQIVGVSELRLAGVVAQSLVKRGVKALVLRGQDGLDEVSIAAPTDVWLAIDSDKTVRQIQISPEFFGEKPRMLEEIQGGEPSYNAEAIITLAQGKSSDAIASAVSMNAALALLAIGAHLKDSRDVQRLILENYEYSQDIIRSGSLEASLTKWRSLQH